MSRSRCYLELDRENFRHNLAGLQAILPQQTGIIGVIKADYYGHGDWQLAQIMSEMGVSDFCVAALSEAVRLRDLGLKGSMLILGYTEQKDWMKAYENDCILTLASYEQVEAMSRFARSWGIVLKVEVKVDTGMHRIGIDPLISDEQLSAIYADPCLKVMGTYSHLCRSDSFAPEDIEYTHRQRDVFDSFLARVAQLGYDCGRRHLCASSGILNYPEFVYDYVRPGFMLLGFTVGEVHERYQRLPVLGWYSRIEMIKTVGEGEGLSYGHIYRCEKPMKIATVSVGYGDGYPRRLSNRGYVVINGQRVPIRGRICMDQMMVDVSGIDCKREDPVTLIGEGCSAEALAEMSGTIVDEIVCDINGRVERVYR